jgi:predicted enzyme related to lactoylglutathione lyase
VAGVGPQQNPGQPIAWTTYVSTRDADDTAKRAAEAGGTILLEPMDVLDTGRLSILADPTGAVLGLWQPGTHKGAQLLNDPGAMCWNELATRDPAAAERFYAHVFGWQPAAAPDGSYTEWKLGGGSIGGMLRMDEQWPAEVPAHWTVYFAVTDCDAAAAKATELGGTVHVQPRDIPAGRFAALSDPHGAAFSIANVPGQAT